MSVKMSVHCRNVPAHANRKNYKGPIRHCKANGKTYPFPRLYSRSTCASFGNNMSGFTKRASCAPWIRRKKKSIRKRELKAGRDVVARRALNRLIIMLGGKKRNKEENRMSNKNIFGTRLEPCRRAGSSDRRGSWDSEGMCSDRGASDPGVHQICFDVRDDLKQFSEETFQSNWSEERLGKRHCMCLGAYALFKARQDAGETESTEGELFCHGIPESALSERYLRNWKTWNGHEEKYELSEKYRVGLDALCNQCSDQARDDAERESLRSACALARSR